MPLISIFLALRQTPAYMQYHGCRASAARGVPISGLGFHWYLLQLPTEGWPG